MAIFDNYYDTSNGSLRDLWAKRKVTKTQVADELAVSVSSEPGENLIENLEMLLGGRTKQNIQIRIPTAPLQHYALQ